MSILAKSKGESLVDHTTWVLKCANALLDTLPDKELSNRIRDKLVLTLALHDVGKVATGFQKALLAGTNWGGKRHEIVSASFASNIPFIQDEVVLAIITHHRSIPTDGLTNEKCLPYEQIPWTEEEPTPVWRTMAKEWMDNSANFKEDWKEICRIINRPDLESCLALAPLHISKSWFQRGVGKGCQIKSFSADKRYEAAVIRGLTIASDHLGSAHYLPPKVPELREYQIADYPPRGFQIRSSQTNESAIIRAPTGSGKTNAALIWAQKNQRHNGRLFYCLPTTASINAMYSILATKFGKEHVGLLHHRAKSSLYTILEEMYDNISKYARQAIARIQVDLAKQMWFPIRVCTPHQILRFALRGKGWETMLVEFPKSCLIFDEIHAYDPRMVGLILGTAKLASSWDAKCLFMSATLPKFLKKLIENVITNITIIEPQRDDIQDQLIINRKRHMLEIKDGSIVDNLDYIQKQIEKSGSSLVVCNHVSTAQFVYTLLQKHFRNGVVLLHSRFTKEDRNLIEKKLLNNPLPKVLVATQVVEVSLNIDFDRGFTEPAPIDALVQRMGRVNRNRIPSEPPKVFTIFTKQIHSYRMYEQIRVDKSLEALSKVQNPLSEEELVTAADIVYGDGYQDNEQTRFLEGYEHPSLAKFGEQLLVGAYEDWIEEVIESTDGSVELLPFGLHSKYIDKLEEGLWLEADSLLVPVRLRSFYSLKDRMIFDHDPWIIKAPYDSILGLDLKADYNDDCIVQ